jgi:CheY-like chemotaxis protein
MLRSETKEENRAMSSDIPLKDKTVLVVDDEPDVLETVEEELDMCRVSKARDYETAFEYLVGHAYDMVILDIMGVSGFKLLKDAASRGIPTAILTAHAFTPDALKQSIKLGAVSFLPKDKMSELNYFLEDVFMNDGKPVWRKLFEKLGPYFDKHFGPDWKNQDIFFKEFLASL